MDKIMIYEDDAGIREELEILLRSNGYLPVSEPPCDLALLDVNMPGESGFDVCRRLRKSSDVPVIFLTARTNTDDELLGFGVGADDYIKKPYESSVLLARISRLLKRAPGNLLTAKGLSLDLSAMTVFFGENAAELSKNEMKILACLMKRELCTREDIIRELWNGSLYIDENTLGVNVKRLREKLSKIGAAHLVRTVRGVGYRL